jgi:hypothetical protein
MSDESKLASDEIVQHYSKTMGIPLEAARERLEARFKKETEGKDLGQQYVLLIKAFREMSPKLNGVVMRESDNIAAIKEVKSIVASLHRDVKDMQERLDFEREVFSTAIKLLNEARVPLHLRLWNRIKCLLGF